MSLFICPICNQILTRKNNTYSCKKAHSFDVSADGYVHLLPSNRKNSKLPGDDKNMVNARARFLSGGYYEPLKTSICELAKKYCPNHAAILDSGCGEGYYTNSIYDATNNSLRKAKVSGIDISKSAARLAAKRCPNAEIAVGSAFHLPIKDNSIDLLLNCFSPLCIEEFARVIKTGGIFLYVVPAPEHLWQMKEVLYEKPYKNELEKQEYKGFEYCEIVRVEGTAKLETPELIRSLFSMTPYFWKTPRVGRDRLEALTCLETKIEFDIHVYRKK